MQQNYKKPVENINKKCNSMSINEKYKNQLKILIQLFIVSQ